MAAFQRGGGFSFGGEQPVLGGEDEDHIDQVEVSGEIHGEVTQ